MTLHNDYDIFYRAIKETSDSTGIADYFIEKDYWITLVLKRLSESKYVNSVVFKGGTSLSKGFKLINRFSEDVDIAVKIKNDGNKNISGGTPIGVGLYLDSSTTPFDTLNKYSGLDIGDTINFNFSWTPSLGDLGQHLFRVVVDYQGTKTKIKKQ